MGREELLIAESIKNTLDQAWEAERAVAKEQGASSPEELESMNSAYEDAEGALGWYLEKAYRDIGILAERLQLPRFAKLVIDDYAGRKNGKTFSSVVRFGPDPHDFHSPTLAAVRELYESLATLTNATALTGLDTLRTILLSTGRIVEDASLTPSKESDVRRAVAPVLRYAFSDIVKEPVLAHPIKSYKPDFGVKGLMSTVEYKFVTSEREARKVLDELYADMKGYSGHDEWRNHFAIIYMTGHFITQDEVDAKLLSIGADKAWTIKVIPGKGSRRKAEG